MPLQKSQPDTPAGSVKKITQKDLRPRDLALKT
jgi:hypothetical protein